MYSGAIIYMFSAGNFQSESDRQKQTRLQTLDQREVYSHF